MKNLELGTWATELESLARNLGQAGPDEVCCEGLTSRQCSILRTLAAQEGARLSDLASAAGISPSAMTRVLEKLEARNLVKRVRGNGADGRAAKVEITPQGRQVCADIGQLITRRTQTILSAIPAGLRPQLLEAVRVLNRTLGPGGCCQISGEWPKIALSCSVDANSKSRQRRKGHVEQSN